MALLIGVLEYLLLLCIGLLVVVFADASVFILIACAIVGLGTAMMLRCIAFDLAAARVYACAMHAVRFPSAASNPDPRRCRLGELPSAPRLDRRSDPEDGRVNLRGRPAQEPSQSGSEGNAESQARERSDPYGRSALVKSPEGEVVLLGTVSGELSDAYLQLRTSGGSRYAVPRTDVQFLDGAS